CFGSWGAVGGVGALSFEAFVPTAWGAPRPTLRMPAHSRRTMALDFVMHMVCVTPFARWIILAGTWAVIRACPLATYVAALTTSLRRWAGTAAFALLVASADTASTVVSDTPRRMRRS